MGFDGDGPGDTEYPSPLEQMAAGEREAARRERESQYEPVSLLDRYLQDAGGGRMEPKCVESAESGMLNRPSSKDTAREIVYGATLPFFPGAFLGLMLLSSWYFYEKNNGNYKPLPSISYYEKSRVESDRIFGSLEAGLITAAGGVCSGIFAFEAFCAIRFRKSKK